MKVGIEVKDRSEATALQTAMADPRVRTFALVMGNLLQLATDKDRRRCLEQVQEQLAETATAKE